MLIRKYLVIQTAFIGDVILALPVAQYLRKTDATAEIHFLVRKGNEDLLINHPAIDRVWTWDKSDKKYIKLLKVIFKLRHHAFDTVFNLHRFASSGLITCLVRANQKIGFSKNIFSFCYSKKYPHQISDMSDNRIVHEVERNLSLLGLNQSIIKPRLFPGIAETSRIKEIIRNKPYVVVAPCSIWYTKQWPLTKWKIFLENIPASFQVFIVGSKNERAYCEPLVGARAGIHNLCGDISFLETAALMKDAFHVFTNDSAPQHLASAVNAPTTTVYCSTVPVFGFGPLSDNRRTVEIDYDLACRPCGLHGHKSCLKKHFLCALDLNPTRLLEGFTWN
jgi:heptosyltransferase-2